MLADLGSVPSDVEAVAAYGKAKNLGRLPSLPRLRLLWLSGVSPKAADVVSRLPRLERLVLFDWRLSSCELLASLTGLRFLAIVQSSRLRRLSGLEALGRVETLILLHNCNYTDLSPLARLANLTDLCLEGAFSKLVLVRTLEPLRHLTGLRRLRLAALRSEDRSLAPLRQLRELRDVFINDLFPQTELAALAAALPEARGEFLDTYRAH